jgi:peptidylprolyl isomerase
VTAPGAGTTLSDGKVFDSSWSRNSTLEVLVGQAQLGQAPQVIEGWDRGLIGVKVGSRMQLDIPAKLAYGTSPPSGAPVGPLRFIVDVLDARS